MSGRQAGFAARRPSHPPRPVRVGDGNSHQALVVRGGDIVQCGGRGSCQGRHWAGDQLRGDEPLRPSRSTTVKCHHPGQEHLPVPRDVPPDARPGDSGCQELVKRDDLVLASSHLLRRSRQAHPQSVAGRLAQAGHSQGDVDGETPAARRRRACGKTAMCTEDGDVYAEPPSIAGPGWPPWEVRTPMRAPMKGRWPCSESPRRWVVIGSVTIPHQPGYQRVLIQDGTEPWDRVFAETIVGGVTAAGSVWSPAWRRACSICEGRSSSVWRRSARRRGLSEGG